MDDERQAIKIGSFRVADGIDDIRVRAASMLANLTDPDIRAQRIQEFSLWSTAMYEALAGRVEGAPPIEEAERAMLAELQSMVGQLLPLIEAERAAEWPEVVEQIDEEGKDAA